MKDFDMDIIYNINPSQVSELYSQKNKTFHAYHDGDIYLMYTWVSDTGRNAAYKVARQYKALEMNDKREAMEEAVKVAVIEAAAKEGVTGVHITRVRIKSITAADVVVASSNNLVKAENDLKQKEVEVKTAEAEARRIAALNANSKAIDYMNAQANYMIAEGVKAGKVQTIVVPVDFKGIVSAGK